MATLNLRINDTRKSNGQKALKRLLEEIEGLNQKLEGTRSEYRSEQVRRHKFDLYDQIASIRQSLGDKKQTAAMVAATLLGSDPEKAKQWSWEKTLLKVVRAQKI